MYPLTENFPKPLLDIKGNGVLNTMAAFEREINGVKVYTRDLFRRD